VSQPAPTSPRGQAAGHSALPARLRSWTKNFTDPRFYAYTGHPADNPEQLRCDLDRFTFLLGGDDGEPLFQPGGSGA
jgi:hypothetical protein